MRLKSWIAAALGWLALALPATAEPAAPPQAHPLDAADLEVWLDGMLPYALETGDIAGAVVVVVKDGQVLFEKGYGYADVAAKKPVDPKKTLFRPGSISKLFTWTAVMQQVEQGKIDLDADVQQYLDFQLPKRADGPITMRWLMTHTAGFEQPLRNLFTQPDTVPLDRYLKDNIPARIFQAGKVPAYSNYGTALAGYIVERVSGERFDLYAQRHIFAPLGMTSATFGPLPASLQADMAKGYDRASGKPGLYEIAGPYPAGSMAVTGDDLARFMIAHLQDGTYNGAQILKPETAVKMHSTPLVFLPPLNHMELGFYDSNRNGHRIIAHAGDTPQFHSDMRLYLDDGVGFLISMNSSGSDYVHYFMRNFLTEAFADRYFPGDVIEPWLDAATAKQHAKLIAGRYDASRGSQSSFISIGSLFGSVTVVARPDGTISTEELAQLNGQPKVWREVRPFVWRNVDGKDHLAARVENGKVTMWSGDDVSPAVVFIPQPSWRSNTGLWFNAVLAALAALSLTAIAWPVAAGARRRYGRSFPLAGSSAVAFRLVRVCAIGTVATAISWFLFMGVLSTDSFPVTARSDWAIWSLRVAGWLFFGGGALVALWNAWLVWTAKRGWFAKLWSPVLAASCLLLLVTAWAFHLLDLNVNY
jgi:CubicO group peptidase (beta-lactamase class C family)